MSKSVCVPRPTLLYSRIGENFVCDCAKPAPLTVKITSSTAHNLRPPGELKAAISIECLTMGIDFPSNRDELDVMMRNMASKSPQAGDQNSSNTHQAHAMRAFVEPVVAILENNTNNFRPVRRGKIFDIELIPFETRAEDGAALIDKNSWQREELHASRKRLGITEPRATPRRRRNTYAEKQTIVLQRYPDRRQSRIEEKAT
jgi:hypothetical protein